MISNQLVRVGGSIGGSEPTPYDKSTRSTSVKRKNFYRLLIGCVSPSHACASILLCKLLFFTIIYFCERVFSAVLREFSNAELSPKTLGT